MTHERGGCGAGDDAAEDDGGEDVEAGGGFDDDHRDGGCHAGESGEHRGGTDERVGALIRAGNHGLGEESEETADGGAHEHVRDKHPARGTRRRR